jgi:drug/metabolite transporter (DMT)-like permease
MRPNAQASSASFLDRLPLPLKVAAFCLLWASAFAAAKLALRDSPPLTLLAFRFLIAGVVILAAGAWSGGLARLSRRDVLLFAVLGVANQAGLLGLGYLGLETISSGLSAIIFSTTPVLTAIMAATFLGETMTWRKAIGLALGVGGVAFVVESRVAGGFDHPAGIALTIAAVASLVGGTILFKKLAPGGDLWVGNGVQSLAAGLVITPFALGFEHFGDVVPTWNLILATAYLALVVSVFAYVLWFHLIKVSGATGASSYHFLMPPLGLLFGWLALGEPVATMDLIGIVPVALGIYLVTRPGAPRREPARRLAPAQ